MGVLDDADFQAARPELGYEPGDERGFAASGRADDGENLHLRFFIAYGPWTVKIDASAVRSAAPQSLSFGRRRNLAFINLSSMTDSKDQDVFPQESANDAIISDSKFAKP
jgi:hypothetical protein